MDGITAGKPVPEIPRDGAMPQCFHLSLSLDRQRSDRVRRLASYRWMLGEVVHRPGETSRRCNCRASRPARSSTKGATRIRVTRRFLEPPRCLMGVPYLQGGSGEKVKERVQIHKIFCGLCERWFKSGIVRSYCDRCAEFLGICPICGSPGETGEDGKRTCSMCERTIRYQFRRGKRFYLKKRKLPDIGAEKGNGHGIGEKGVRA